MTATYTPMTALTVINATTGLMDVHAAGCSDLVRARRRANGAFTMEVQDRTAALLLIWDDFAGEMTVEEMDRNTRFLPCATAVL